MIDNAIKTTSKKLVDQSNLKIEEEKKKRVEEINKIKVLIDKSLTMTKPPQLQQNSSMSIKRNSNQSDGNEQPQLFQ